MDIFPSIDLRNGKCVRLLQGDYDRQIDYSDDPVGVARDFAAAGAQWLHVVDLDGARSGQIYNTGVIQRIVEQSGLKVQVGGGVRSVRVIQRLLDAGVTRVIIGTQAMKQWDWFKETVYYDEFAGRIVLGLDARGGKLALEGWTEQTALTADEIAAQVTDWPLSAIVYTDIARDGMLTGPNLKQTEMIAQVTDVPIIASGGVGTLDDIRALVRLPLAGMIIGRALYEGKFELADAVNVVKGIK